METESFSERGRTSARKLAILGYHKIGDPPPQWWSWQYIPEEIFAAHLNHIREAGWQVIDFLALLRGIAAPESLPERAALLTFDDGYRSMRTVPTDYIGGFNRFGAGNEPEEAICGWDDLRELERSGVSIQSHGASHRPFSELDLPEQAEELTRSKAILEAGLKKPVEVFAYPYGDGGTEPHSTVRALKRTGYRAACLYKGGPKPLGGPNHLPIADPYRLVRLAMGPDTNLQVALE